MDAVSQFTTAAGNLRMQTMIGSPEYLKTNPAQTNPTTYDPNFKYPGEFVLTIR